MRKLSLKSQSEESISYNHLESSTMADSKTSKDLDDLLAALGTGRWNLFIFFLSGFSSMRIPAQALSAAFCAPAIDYTCVSPYDGRNINSSDANADQCYNGDTEKYCTDWDYDTSTFSYTLTNQHDLVCGQSYLRSSYSSIYMFGSMIGSFVIGYLADWKGRKLAMDIGIIGLSIEPILMSFVPPLTFTMMCRLLGGFLHTLTISSFFTLALEVCEPRLRGTVGIVLALPWAFGTIAWGGLAYLIRDWRWLNFVASIPSVLCLPSVWLVDESPRWLVVNGHHDKALKMLQKAARVNKATLPPEEEIMEIFIRTQQNSKKNAIAKSETDSKFKQIVRETSILFSTSQLRLRSFVMLFLFFTSSMIFYGLSLSAITLSADPYIYMALGGLMEVPGYSVASPIINHWGRKGPTVVCYFICGVTILILAFVPHDISWLVITLAMIGKLTISMAYQVIYLYIIEILPTEVRFQGLGASMLASRIGSILTPYVTDYLGTGVYSWLPSAIFGSCSLIGGFLTLLLPESKGRPMPDTVTELENQEISEMKEKANPA